MTDLIDINRSALLVIDIQERLVPAMANGEAVVAGAELLVRAAKRLGVPVLVSEQYPRGLGHTKSGIAALVEPGDILPKMHFSAAADPDIRARMRKLGCEQVIICGIEAHVCVLQTALGLRASGSRVFVVADALSSRNPLSVELAIDRMRGAGCAVVNAEMVVFEWLQKAGTPEFRELSALIK